MDKSTADEELRSLADLPADVTSMILSKIGAIDVLTSAQNVCSSWLRICRDPAMWRNIDMHNFGDLWDIDHDLEKMCRHAVDRSEGSLLSINIEYFGTDELLEYIARRSSMLDGRVCPLCQRPSLYVTDELQVCEDLNDNCKIVFW